MQHMTVHRCCTPWASRVADVLCFPIVRLCTASAMLLCYCMAKLLSASHHGVARMFTNCCCSIRCDRLEAVLHDRVDPADCMRCVTTWLHPQTIVAVCTSTVHMSPDRVPPAQETSSDTSSALVSLNDRMRRCNARSCALDMHLDADNAAQETCPRAGRMFIIHNLTGTNACVIQLANLWSGQHWLHSTPHYICVYLS
jgi:hypothetical protein